MLHWTPSGTTIITDRPARSSRSARTRARSIPSVVAAPCSNMSPLATEPDAPTSGPAPQSLRPEQTSMPRHEHRPAESSGGFARDLGYRVTIRTLDIVVSATALVLLAPLMLVIALLIRADSPGPVV